MTFLIDRKYFSKVYIYIYIYDLYIYGSDGSAMLETQVQSLGQEDPLEKETATHPSILAWEIPRTEEAGGLQSVGLQELDRT